MIEQLVKDKLKNQFRILAKENGVTQANIEEMAIVIQPVIVRDGAGKMIDIDLGIRGFVGEEEKKQITIAEVVA